MQITTFNKGLNTRLAPHLISADNSVVCNNVDIESGILKPVKSVKDLGINSKNYFNYSEYHKNYISYDSKSDFVEYNDVTYITNGIKPKKYNRLRQYRNLGIQRPIEKPKIVNTASAKPINGLSVTNKITSGNLPSSPLVYVLVNVKNGIYSKPLLITCSASVTNDMQVNTEILNVSSETELYRYLINKVNFTSSNLTGSRFIEFTDLKDPIADTAELYRFYNGELRFLNSFNDENEIFSDSVYNISANNVFDFSKVTSFNGTYQYVYTFYNSLEDVESAPSPISDEIYLVSGAIKLFNIKSSSDEQVNKKRIYRVGGNTTSFTLVSTIDNEVLTYTDTIPDTNLSNTLLISNNYYEPPTDLKYITEAYSILFGASGNKLRFTPVNKPEAWPPEYEITFNSTITGIAVVSTGILVFSKYKTYLVTGNDPLSFNSVILDRNKGCIEHKSISEIGNGSVIWATDQDLSISSGTEVKSLTKSLLGKIELNPINSTVHNEIYYCLNSDNTILVADYRYGLSIYYLALTLDYINFADGKLIGINNGTLKELLVGDNYESMSYKSPVFTDALEKIANGSLVGVNLYTEYKTYKKVYISYTGQINFKIYLDGELCCDYNLSGSAVGSTPKLEVIQVPFESQRGFSIQFEINGIGEVYEIQYDPGDRKND